MSNQEINFREVASQLHSLQRQVRFTQITWLLAIIGLLVGTGIAILVAGISLNKVALSASALGLSVGVYALFTDFFQKKTTYVENSFANEVRLVLKEHSGRPVNITLAPDDERSIKNFIEALEKIEHEQPPSPKH